MSEVLTRASARPQTLSASRRYSRELRCTLEECRRPAVWECELREDCGRRWFPVECVCNPLTYSEAEEVLAVCKDFQIGPEPARCARCGHDLPCHRNPPGMQSAP